VLTDRADLTDQVSEARREIEAHCQSLVDAGIAQWRINADGGRELHMGSGEKYLFACGGVTRLM
jgi:hypothetical protein